MRWVLRRAATAPLWILAAWTIWLSVRRGRSLQREAPEVFLGAAPLIGRNFRDGWDWRFGWGLIGAGAIALLLVASCWREWWWRAQLRWVILATAGAALLFALALALTDGADGVLFGASDPTEYLSNLELAPPAGQYVDTFIERIDDYSVHLRGHPPGFLLVLKLLDAVHLAGAWPVALLSVLGAALLPIGVLLTVREVAGDDWVRRAAPFLVVAPYAVWMVTSADAVFTAMGSLGIALFASAPRRPPKHAAVLGLAGGLIMGILLFFTYLTAVLLIVPAVLLLGRRRAEHEAVLPTIAGGVVGAAVVTAGFLAAGFWWFEGAGRTKIEYWDGSAQFRLWDYFGYANLAVAMIALGPAALAGMLRLRDRRMWIIVGTGLSALLVSHFSQYTRGEVERIWLLFFPWITVAGAALYSQVRYRRGALWIGVQATGAIVLQAALVSKW